ncbi:MAG: carboxypeptidase-like regulatory domain-containing protein [Sphingobacteriaceae bacterium]|nr:MAG: carboxypeptidase-like regulatory domain-containing protein [Sphingobacteriaceae bacterium]
MKNRFLFTISFLALLLLAYPIYAQQGIVVSGKVTSDGQPIALTSISVSKKGIGTSTNSSGMFILTIPAANKADSLQISHIGFKSQTLPISGIKVSEQLNIVLEKNSTELGEVTVTYYDANKIINKAINLIPENYVNHAHILRGFYRMYAFKENKDKAPLQLSEAVFDVYNFGYADKHADIFRLIKARSEKNDRDFNSAEFVQKPNSVFEQDVVNHLPASGFLSEKGLEIHKFEVERVTEINGLRAYEITFTGKPGADVRTYNGKMYIDTKTNAFIYFDYGLSPAGLKNTSAGGFLEKSLVKQHDIKAVLLTNRSKVSYQQVNNKWVLANVDGDNTLSIKSVYLDYNYVAHVKYNYQITAVDMSEKGSFDSKIGRNENINQHKSDSDQKFWKDYNILLADENADDIFKQIRDINKEKESLR